MDKLKSCEMWILFLQWGKNYLVTCENTKCLCLSPISRCLMSLERRISYTIPDLENEASIPCLLSCKVSLRSPREEFQYLWGPLTTVSVYLIRWLEFTWWSMAEISQIFLIAFWWSCVGIGSYLLYQLILYMKSKAPGHQSLLDDMYQDLFQKWIASTILLALAATLIELEIKSWIASLMIGWPSFTLIVSSHIHLMFCGLMRFGLTFHQGYVEQIPEKLTKRYIW